jgi:hypothetical protein
MIREVESSVSSTSSNEIEIVNGPESEDVSTLRTIVDHHEPIEDSSSIDNYDRMGVNDREDAHDDSLTPPYQMKWDKEERCDEIVRIFNVDNKELSSAEKK